MTSTPEIEKAPGSTLDKSVLTAIVVVGVMLRTQGLPLESAWSHEVASLRALDTTDVIGYWHILSQIDPAATLSPVYYTVQFVWSRLVGIDAERIRLLSVLFGALSLPLIFLIGQKLYGVVAGAVASTCLAMSLAQAYYGQAIQPYSLLCLLSLLSVYTLIEALSGRGAWWWALHVTLNALLLWTHPFAVFQLAAEGAFLTVFYRDRRLLLKRWALAHGFILLLAGYWLWRMPWREMLPALAAPELPVPLAQTLGATLLFLSGGRFSLENPVLYFPRGLSFDHLIGIFVLFMTLWLLAWSLFSTEGVSSAQRHLRRPVVLTFLALWLIIPLLAFAVLGGFHRPWFAAPYVLYASLPLFLMAGGAIDALRYSAAQSMAVAALAACYAYQSLMLPTPFRPDYRMAARLIENHQTPRDLVIAFGDGKAAAFRFHSSMTASNVEPALEIGAMGKALARAQRHGRNVWILVQGDAETAVLDEYLIDHELEYVPTELGGLPPLTVYYIPGEDSGEPAVVHLTRVEAGTERLSACEHISPIRHSRESGNPVRIV